MKYGLLTIRRTLAKTVTFLLLIASITVFLSLGFGMWQSAENMLNEADATFTTAGEFVYASDDNTNPLYFDTGLEAASDAFDLNLLNRDETLYIEENITQRAILDGYKPSTREMPLKNFAILAVNIRHYDEDVGGYTAIITKDVYSTYSMQDSYSYILCEKGGFGFEEGGRYIIFAAVKELLGQNTKCLEPMPFSVLSMEDYTSGYDSIASITEYKDMQDFYDTDTGSFYLEIGKLIETLNNSIDVTATGDVSIIESFHNGRYVLTDGNLFDNLDTNVCVIPKRISAQMKLSVGDTISLSFHYPTAKTGRFYSFRPDVGFAAENLEYRIVGIYQADELTSPVFIPNAGQSWLGHSDNDYVLARVSVDNRNSAAYSDIIKGTLPKGVTFSLYDQGYKAAVMSINTLRDTAVMISVYCLVLCVFILWLFGLLFISRNERNAKVLLTLGAGKKRVMLYFLSGAGVISTLASVIGAVAGYFISKNVFSTVFESIQSNSVYDFRFSVIGFGVKSEAFAVKPEVNPLAYILLALAVTCTSLVFCFFFAARVIGKQNPRNKFKARAKAESSAKSTQPKRSVGSGFIMRLPSASLRYSVKSILRGGKRSLVVPLLFAVMLFFICVFHNINAGYQTRLNTVYDDIPVTMRFTDINGRKVDGLVITSVQTDAVKDSNFAEKDWATANHSFMVLGISEYADGTLPETPPEPFVPSPSAYARETFIEQWNIRSDKNVFMKIESGITAFEYAPEFAFSAAPEIMWADGFDEATFFSSGEEVEKVIVSEDFLRKHNVSIGDTISVIYIFYPGQFINNPEGSYLQLDLEICGSFEGASTKPVAYSYYSGNDVNSTYERSWPNWKLVYQLYNSAGFLLNNTENLSELKDSLEELFDPLGKAGKNRIWTIIDDTALYNTVDNLTRYIGYMNMLYPIILALAAGMGFLVSHLLLKSRAGEIAILRGIGAPKFTVFFSYFNEQFLLSLVGAAVGLIIAALIIGGTSAIDPMNVLPLTVCYYAGLALAIINTYRKAAIDALSAKEE